MSERRLLMGSTVLPLAPPAMGGSLLAAGDPVLAAALPYWQYCINHYFEAAYLAAMAGQGLRAPVGKRACLEVMPADPEPFLFPLGVELPLLACWPVTGKPGQLTMHRNKNVGSYRLAYVLPEGLDADQHKRLTPMLKAVIDMLVLVTNEGGLDHYQAGKRVWEEAGASTIAITSWEIGYFAKNENLASVILALQADLEVMTKSRWDSSYALDLTRTDATVAAADPDGGDALPVVQLNVTPDP